MRKAIYNPAVILAGAVLLLLAAAGCPNTGPKSTTAVDPAKFKPSEEIPEEHQLLSYANLWLGMSSLDMSQVYNAPDGRGDGFVRYLEQHGAVTTQTIVFDKVEGEPDRRIVAMFYRDQLYWLVERGEGLSAEQMDTWFKEVVRLYGDKYDTILPTSQWTWGDAAGILLTFTRDNATENRMNGTVTLIHNPTYKAAHAYLEVYEQRNPPD